MNAIDRKTSVNRILQEHPELTDFMMDLGLCGCGHDTSLLWTVERVAVEKGLNPDQLVEELRKRTAS